jgi:hypothetical protein
MDTGKSYKNALMAEATYAGEARNPDGSFDNEKVKKALKSEDFSETQAQDFVEDWQVVAHQPNTFSGLSVTVFENKQSGEKALAVRGSDGPFDFITDAGILEGVTPEQANQCQELKSLVDGWLADGTLSS